jgi:hypothetical protein
MEPADVPIKESIPVLAWVFAEWQKHRTKGQGLRIKEPTPRETKHQEKFKVRGDYRRKPTGRVTLYTRLGHTYFAHCQVRFDPRDKTWEGDVSIDLQWDFPVDILLIEFPPDWSFVDDYYWTVYNAIREIHSPIGIPLKDFPKGLIIHDQISVKPPNCK